MWLLSEKECIFLPFEVWTCASNLRGHLSAAQSHVWALFRSPGKSVVCQFLPSALKTRDWTSGSSRASGLPSRQSSLPYPSARVQKSRTKRTIPITWQIS